MASEPPIPNPANLEHALKAAIEESLKLYVYPNAVFLAERLFATFPSLDNLAIVANCYITTNDPQTAYRLLHHHQPFSGGNEALKCHYLFGVSCGMTQRFAECEKTMTELAGQGYSVHGGTEYWLGVSSRRLSRKWAADHFEASVAANPAMFASFENLCKFFASPNLHNPYLPGGGDAGPAAAVVSPLLPPSAANDLTTGPARRASGGLSLSNPTNALRAGASSFPTAAPRRSASAKVGGSGTPPAQAAAPPAVPGDELRCFLRPYADAALLLNTYRCVDAIRLVTSDAFPEKESGFVLTTCGLAYFHSGMFGEAEQWFLKLRDVEPWRLNDQALVYYSTTLWHLKNDKPLSALSQHLLEDVPNSSVALAVSGNAYSLAKDSKNAVQQFTKAIAVDKSHAYAYTLRGYELLAMGQMTDAEAAFMDAQRIEPRHYMAFAGLGEIAFRRDHDQRAQSYFQTAVNINMLPSVMNRLAIAILRQGSANSLRQALGVVDQALQRNPGHLPARLQRVDILIQLRDYDAALRELEVLRRDCPEEAVICIHIARCYHRTNQSQRAVKMYNKALDLDPRRAAYVKSCLDKIANNIPDDD